MLLKNTMLYFIGTFSSSLLSFFLLPIYTRYLSPEDYGKVDVIFAVAFVVTPIITLQVSFACYRYLFECKDRREIKTIVSNAFLVFCIGNALFAAIFLISSAFFPIEYEWAILLFILLGGGAGFLQTLARGMGENSLYSLLGVLSTLFSLIANIVFIIGLNLKSLSLLLAPICGSVVIIVVASLKLKLFELIERSLVSKRIITTLLRYSWPLVPDAICWWLLLGFGRVYLNYQQGAEAVGILAVASKFPSLLTSFYAVFNLAWKENAISEFSAKDRDAYYSSIYNAQVVIVLCGILVLLPLIRLSIQFLLSDSFQSAYEYIPILFISSALAMLSSFWGSGFESAKETRGILVSTLAAFVANLILNIILVPLFSIYGVAIANVGAYAVLFFARVVKSRRFFQISVDRERILPLSLLFFLFCGLYYLQNTIAHCCLLIISIGVFIFYNLLVIKKILLHTKQILAGRK